MSNKMYSDSFRKKISKSTSRLITIAFDCGKLLPNRHAALVHLLGASPSVVATMQSAVPYILADKTWELLIIAES